MKRMNFYTSLTLSFLLLLSWPNGEVFAATYVKSLLNSSTVEIESFYQKPTIAIVFQENCTACRQQIKNLSCLEKDFDIILLGAFSDERNLRQDYLKSKVSYPAYYASQDVLNELKIKNSVTPQILLISKTKQKSIMGYNPCTKLQSLLAD